MKTWKLTLAVGLVAFTVLGVAQVAHWFLPGFNWRMGFVLGAVVAPTDAIAATSIAKRIGLPKRTQGVLKALGLRQRMKTVFYPVTPEVAGQIMRVKELVAVREVDRPLTKEELKAERRPDPGFYLESAVPR